MNDIQMTRFKQTTFPESWYHNSFRKGNEGSNTGTGQ
ncbi:hypothetical protein EVA_13036 [gut metagenome]|uniref:Uncharacterized protein n=1 Tax=gut metagenome TaxID=749906 RepID=J9GAR0_9ZZZZ